MLAFILAIFAVTWALWLTFQIRYPSRWQARIDRQHEFLRQYGLSSRWMQKHEKGMTLKVLVGFTTVITLMCLVILLRYPHALDYLLKK